MDPNELETTLKKIVDSVKQLNTLKRITEENYFAREHELHRTDPECGPVYRRFYEIVDNDAAAGLDDNTNRFYITEAKKLARKLYAEYDRIAEMPEMVALREQMDKVEEVRNEIYRLLDRD
jgi:plasmid stabilization system protein ParE